jgi:hypothetical protein
MIIFGGLAFVIGWLTTRSQKFNDSNTKPTVNVDDERESIELVGQVSQSDKDNFYSQALKEIESNELDHATWARAFSDAEGVENRARALYIKYRVERLCKDS